jgi:hypothetical protein
MKAVCLYIDQWSLVLGQLQNFCALKLHLPRKLVQDEDGSNVGFISSCGLPVEKGRCQEGQWQG